MNILLDNGTIRGAFRALGHLENDYVRIAGSRLDGFTYEAYKAVSSAFDLDMIALSVLIEAIAISDKVFFVDRSKRSTSFWSNHVPDKYGDVLAPITLSDKIEGWLIDFGIHTLENMKHTKNLNESFEKVVTVQTFDYEKSNQYYSGLYGLMDTKFEYPFATFQTDTGLVEQHESLSKSLESAYTHLSEFPKPKFPLKDDGWGRFYDSHYKAFRVFSWLILQTLMYWTIASDHALVYSPHPMRLPVLDSADDLLGSFRPKVNLNTIVHGKISKFLGEIASSVPGSVTNFSLISKMPPIAHYIYKHCSNRSEILETAKRIRNTRSLRKYRRVLSRIMSGKLSQSDFYWTIREIDKVLNNLKEEWGLGEGLSITLSKLPISLPRIPLPARIAFKQFHPFKSHLSLIREATEYMSNELLFANTVDALFLAEKRSLLKKLGIV